MLKIRLRRMGSKARPFYRIVVSESRSTPKARVVDTLGVYDPMKSPKVVRLDVDRVDEWVAKGAQPSVTVARLVEQHRKAAAQA